MGFASRRPDWSLPQLELDSLQLDPFDALQQAAPRQPCPRCQRSRHLFCYNCCVPFTAVPSVELPFKLRIITHHAEKPSKNTGVHAAVLCPGQVVLSSIDELPPELDASRCAVMFPSADALLPEQLQPEQLDHLIIIDSVWRKARELNEHPALAGMNRVKLPGSPRSRFWRFHTAGVADEGVCTIEALHLLLSAMAGHLQQPPFLGNPRYFDNLLWYFAHQHLRVQQAVAARQAAGAQPQRRVLQNEIMKKRGRRQQQQQQHGQQSEQQQESQQGQEQRQEDEQQQTSEDEQQQAEKKRRQPHDLATPAQL